MKHKKSLEEYRRLADKCRETARYLLSMAQTWDLIADRLEASRAEGERSAVTDHDSPAMPPPASVKAIAPLVGATSAPPVKN
jgi:hypothetical protein